MDVLALCCLPESTGGGKCRLMEDAVGGVCSGCCGQRLWVEVWALCFLLESTGGGSCWLLEKAAGGVHGYSCLPESAGGGSCRLLAEPLGGGQRLKIVA